MRGQEGERIRRDIVSRRERKIMSAFISKPVRRFVFCLVVSWGVSHFGIVWMDWIELTTPTHILKEMQLMRRQSGNYENIFLFVCIMRNK